MRTSVCLGGPEVIGSIPGPGGRGPFGSVSFASGSDGLLVSLCASVRQRVWHTLSSRVIICFSARGPTRTASRAHMWSLCSKPNNVPETRRRKTETDWRRTEVSNEEPGGTHLFFPTDVTDGGAGGGAGGGANHRDDTLREDLTHWERKNDTFNNNSFFKMCFLLFWGNNHWTHQTDIISYNILIHVCVFSLSCSVWVSTTSSLPPLNAPLGSPPGLKRRKSTLILKATQWPNYIYI